jgi:hypothetical protein
MDDPQAPRYTVRGWVRAMVSGVEGGGSEPHLFEVVEGPAQMVKAQNNPQGLRVLANELVGSLCLDWLDVVHPPGAIVDLPPEILNLSPGAVFNNGTPLASGESFGSEHWQSDPQGAVDVALIENRRDVAGAMALDTWIQPHDARQYRVRASADVPGRYEFIPLDQGHCFGNPEWTAASFADAPAPVLAAPVCPVDAADVQNFAQRLRSFQQRDAERMVDQVPAAWLAAADRSELVSYLTSRAPHAADALEAAYS